MTSRSWLSQGLSSLSSIRSHLTELTNEVLQEVTTASEDEVVDLVEARHHIRSLQGELDFKSEELKQCQDEVERLKAELQSRHAMSSGQPDGTTDTRSDEFSLEAWNFDDSFVVDRPDVQSARAASLEEQFSPSAYQFEIRKLTREVEQLNAECGHWKELLRQSEAGQRRSEKDDELNRLRAEVERLQQQLSEAAERAPVQVKLSAKEKEEENSWGDDWGSSDAWDVGNEQRCSVSSSLETAQRSSGHAAVLEDLGTADWRDEVRKIQEERDQALEELDREHQEAICQMMMIKENLAKTCDDLREENQHLLDEVAALKCKVEEATVDSGRQAKGLEEELSALQRKYEKSVAENAHLKTNLDAVCDRLDHLQPQWDEEMRLNEMNDLRQKLDDAEASIARAVEARQEDAVKIAEYENTIVKLSAQLEEAESKPSSAEPEDFECAISTAKDRTEAFLADLKTLVHGMCKRYNVGESKEAEVIRCLAELREESARREQDSTTWQWLTQKSSEGNGESGSVDVKTLQSSSTAAESLSAHLSDEFAFDNSASLQYSQAKAIEELNEKNYELSAKLKKAEELAAYQSTVISFLRQSVDAGFKEFRNAMLLLERYRYYVGRTTAINIESVDVFPSCQRSAIEYPQQSASLADVDHWSAEDFSDGGRAKRARKRARSVGAVVYRPSASKEPKEDDMTVEFQDQLKTVVLESIVSPDVKLMHEKMEELQEQLELMKLKEIEYQESLKLLDGVHEEQDRTALVELHRTQMKRDELNSMLSDSQRQLETARSNNEALTSENSRLEAELEQLKKDFSLLQSQAHDVQSRLDAQLMEQDQMMAVINQKHEESVNYYTMLQAISSVVYGQPLDATLPHSPLLLAVEGMAQKAASGEARVHELQTQVDSLAASLIAVQKQLVEKENQWNEVRDQQVHSKTLTTQVEQLEADRSKATAEVERLKAHLLEMEDAYSQEACKAEDRETDLRGRLHQAEQRLAELTESADKAREQLTEELTGMRNKFVLVIEERDAAVMQVEVLKKEWDKCQQSLLKLQNVLETFKKEKEQSQDQLLKSYSKELETLRTEVNDLKVTNETLEEQLRQQNDLGKRLFDLENVVSGKEEQLTGLKSRVMERDRMILTLEKQMEDVRRVADGRIDREVLKNLLMGYFLAPARKKSEVAHLLGSVLGFTPEEFQRVEGCIGGGGSGWLQFLSSGASTSSPGGEQNEQSLVKEFVKFLETESSPQPHVQSLPLGAVDQQAGSFPPGSLGAEGSGNTSAAAPVPVLLDMPVFSQAQLQRLPDVSHGASSSDFLKQLLNPENAK